MAPIDFSRSNSLGDEINGYFRFDFVTTRKEVDAYGFVLRPSVGREMRLGDDHDAGEPVR